MPDRSGLDTANFEYVAAPVSARRRFLVASHAPVATLGATLVYSLDLVDLHTPLNSNRQRPLRCIQTDLFQRPGNGVRSTWWKKTFDHTCVIRRSTKCIASTLVDYSCGRQCAQLDNSVRFYRTAQVKRQGLSVDRLVCIQITQEVINRLWCFIVSWASVSPALLPGCPAYLFCNITVCCIISVLF